AEAGIPCRGRGTFDQSEHCGVRNARLGVGEIGPPEGDLIQQIVRRHAATTHLLDDEDGWTGCDFRYLGHRSHRGGPRAWRQWSTVCRIMSMPAAGQAGTQPCGLVLWLGQ